jgi:hypothetical protein
MKNLHVLPSFQICTFTAEWSALLLWIQEILESNLGLDIRAGTEQAMVWCEGYAGDNADDCDS